jgi:hypothetical protein
MIQVIDNFLEAELFETLQEHCETSEFKITKAGEKEFCVLDTPHTLLKYLTIPGQEIILTFIRKAYPGFDEDYRIHADGLIAEKQTTLASVLYINKPKGVTKNGTSFWVHEKHGDRLTNYDNKEFDRLLTEDANDLSKWEQTDMIYSKPNRLLVYDSSLFHSKFPAKIEEGERTVLVTFYGNPTT